MKSPLTALRRHLVGRHFLRAGFSTYAFSALTLVANLVSGVVTARGLGSQGRGVLVSLATFAQISGFLFAMGAGPSVSYFLGRRPEDGPRLLTTWLLMLLPLVVVAIVLSQLLLPTIFAVQSSGAIASGRWFLFTIVLVIGLELNSGLLLGENDLFVFNFLRFAQPALVAVGVALLWGIRALSVNRALLVATGASMLVLTIGMVRSWRRIRPGKPDWELGSRTLWYGARGHGVMVATNLNARLDVALLPAYVAAASVGIYSVAGNVSLIIYQMSNTFAGILIPAVARDAAGAERKVIGSLFATVAVAGVLAAGLAIFARPLLGGVYGHQFRAAATILRLLLPGAVLFAGASILNAGIYALGKPFTASAAQLLGMVITVVGLVVFLPIGGTTAAAAVSTCAYAIVFVASMVAYKRAADLPWGVFIPTPSRLLALVR